MTEPDPRSKLDKEVTDSFIIVMKFISELRLDIDTIRAFMRGEGVTDDAFAEIRAELRKRYDEQIEPKIEKMAEGRKFAELLKLLDKRGAPKQ